MTIQDDNAVVLDSIYLLVRINYIGLLYLKSGEEYVSTEGFRKKSLTAKCRAVHLGCGTSSYAHMIVDGIHKRKSQIEKDLGMTVS